MNISEVMPNGKGFEKVDISKFTVSEEKEEIA